MKDRESGDLSAARHQKLAVVQEHYRNFDDFLQDVMSLLGFSTTPVQRSIGKYLETGPARLMVQAQRSQAKTTIAAAYAVWDLIHYPKHRILVVSAGGAQASDISTLIVRIIMNMAELACMRPDKAAGDRTSYEGFDIHHSLKGVEKSASVSCVGIEATLQGRRADVLIADDVESSKNGLTAGQRAKILHQTKDFSSIVQTGRIIWLGTPQSRESIYNTLPSRGVEIRIWPGRFPTIEQRKSYGNRLAPEIDRALAANPSLGTGGGLLGDQGMPLDPYLLSEAKLQDKELDQGASFFQLQHMLNTTLLDAERFPLRLTAVQVLDGIDPAYPVELLPGMLPSSLQPFEVGGFSFNLMAPADVSKQVIRMPSRIAVIDPAGGGLNGDETAVVIGGLVNATIYVDGVAGFRGGYAKETLGAIAQYIASRGCTHIMVEKNMGYGAFKEVFEPIMRALGPCSVEDFMVSGRKELRIIRTLEPVIGRGSLVFSRRAVEEDRYYCNQRSGSTACYSVFHQMAHVTEASGSLEHDDRLDALASLVVHFQDHLATDQRRRLAQQAAKDFADFTKNPLGLPTQRPAAAPTLLARWRR